MDALVIDGPRWWARVTPDKPAVTFEGDTLTYAELDGWSGRIAQRLADEGVEAGDRVATLAANSLEYCATSLAIYRLGAVAVPFATRLTTGELKVLADSAGPKVVVADADHAEKVADQLSMEGLAALREGDHVDLPRPAVDPGDPAALSYTSGTTGIPKGVIFTHRTILSTVAEWDISEAGFNQEMKLLMVLPLGSTPGLMWGITHTFIRGGTLVLTRQFKPDRALATLVDEGVTAMVGVPLLYEAMAAQPGFADADLSKLDVAHVGGARVSTAMLKKYSDKDVLLRQIYGMTELGGSVTAVPRDKALELPDTCGCGNPFTRLRTIRDDGSECEPGEPGEILIQGPSVTPGYWNDPEATAESIRDGWLHSGDLGSLDEQGYLRMHDRMKDLIITGGLNVAPTEIENVIDRLDAVAEVAVLSADDEKFGETPAAIVRLTGEIDADAIVAHCNEHLADYKVPRYVIFVDDDLPRMASGKIAKKQLRQDFADIHKHHEKVR